jgi:hypothetical protein
MKAVVNGIEVEGTVDEIVDLKIKLEIETVEETVVNKQYIKRLKKSQKIRKCGPSFDHKEKIQEAIPFYLKGYSMSRSLRIIGINPYGALIEEYRGELAKRGIVAECRKLKKGMKTKFRSNKGWTKDKRERAAKRLREVNAIHYGRNIPLKQAWAIYNSRERLRIPTHLQGKIKQKKYMPKKDIYIYMETISNQPLFRSVVKEVIKNGSTMTYKNDGYVLGIKNRQSWSVFVSEFMKNAFKISMYFGVNNRFKKEKNDSNVFDITYCSTR